MLLIYYVLGSCSLHMLLLFAHICRICLLYVCVHVCGGVCRYKAGNGPGGWSPQSLIANIKSNPLQGTATFRRPATYFSLSACAHFFLGFFFFSSVGLCQLVSVFHQVEGLSLHVGGH